MTIFNSYVSLPEVNYAIVICTKLANDLGQHIVAVIARFRLKRELQYPEMAMAMKFCGGKMVEHEVLNANIWNSLNITLTHTVRRPLAVCNWGWSRENRGKSWYFSFLRIPIS